MYRIEEFPEVWIDACLRDSEGRLMFISVYGRDGSLMQLLAAFELGRSQRGVERFHLLGPDGERHRVEVGGAQRLAKHAGKLPRQNLFGPLNQMWLFDKALQSPDRANRIGWALHARGSGQPSDADDAQFGDRIWQLVTTLSPVALQAHWRQPVHAWCHEHEAAKLMDSALYPAIGPVRAMRISLSDHFTTFISESVRSGALTL